jgi:hypothetical protein
MPLSDVAFMLNAAGSVAARAVNVNKAPTNVATAPMNQTLVRMSVY